MNKAFGFLVLAALLAASSACFAQTQAAPTADPASAAPAAPAVGGVETPEPAPKASAPQGKPEKPGPFDALMAYVLAIGALGAAAAALVDATKLLRKGGASNSGFSYIEKTVQTFLPNERLISMPDRALSNMLDIVHANWINGMDMISQRAVTKTMVKLRLDPTTAPGFAQVTGVDPAVLTEVAKHMAVGKRLTDEESTVFGRFDLNLTAMLDAAYQRADQTYRNNAKVWASIVAMALALFAGAKLHTADRPAYWGSDDMWVALLCGLLAVPLAPIAKDLANALGAAGKAIQAARRA